jgi:hypothetical protein
MIVVMETRCVVFEVWTEFLYCQFNCVGVQYVSGLCNTHDNVRNSYKVSRIWTFMVMSIQMMVVLVAEARIFSTVCRALKMEVVCFSETLVCGQKSGVKNSLCVHNTL